MKLKLIIYDFDGVMTDNRAICFEDGREAVIVNRSDGLAVGLIREMGIKQIIISTELNPVVSARARKLKIPVYQGAGNKKKIIERYLKDNKIDKEFVAFVGNDINDIQAMKFVGWPVSPQDACDDIKKVSRIVLTTRGGYGVVRELWEKIRKENE